MLKTTFKNLYTLEEESKIIEISSHELPLPNAWNDLISYSQYHHRINSNVLGSKIPYFPHIFLTIHLEDRKLFISRLQVLTRFYHKNAIILYISLSINFLTLFVDFK